MSQTVCVYTGLGSGVTSATIMKNYLQDALDQSVFSVQWITPNDIKTGFLRTNIVTLLVIGGGYDLGFIEALGDDGTDEIKTYVASGGSYFGICAGAYFASSYCEFDKGGDLEVCGERRLKFYPGKCVGPAYPGFRYNSDEGAHIAKISIMTDSGGEIYTYFNGGGAFHDSLHGDHDSAEIVGGKDNRYRIIGRFLEGAPAGQVAIVECAVKKGRALLSAVHIEYRPEDLTIFRGLDESSLNKFIDTDLRRREFMQYILSYFGLGDA